MIFPEGSFRLNPKRLTYIPAPYLASVRLEILFILTKVLSAMVEIELGTKVSRPFFTEKKMGGIKKNSNPSTLPKNECIFKNKN